MAMRYQGYGCVKSITDRLAVTKQRAGYDRKGPRDDGPLKVSNIGPESFAGAASPRSVSLVTFASLGYAAGTGT